MTFHALTTGNVYVIGANIALFGTSSHYGLPVASYAESTIRLGVHLHRGSDGAQRPASPRA